MLFSASADLSSSWSTAAKAKLSGPGRLSLPPGLNDYTGAGSSAHGFPAPPVDRFPQQATLASLAPDLSFLLSWAVGLPVCLSLFP